MGTASRRYEAADEEWERIKRYFEKPAGRKPRRPRNDDRQMLKLFRRIVTRYDKLARRFLAFVHLACIFIWLA